MKKRICTSIHEGRPIFEEVEAVTCPLPFIPGAFMVQRFVKCEPHGYYEFKVYEPETGFAISCDGSPLAKYARKNACEVARKNGREEVARVIEVNRQLLVRKGVKLPVNPAEAAEEEGTA